MVSADLYHIETASRIIADSNIEQTRSSFKSRLRLIHLSKVGCSTDQNVRTLTEFAIATQDTPIWLVDLVNPNTSFKVPDRVWLFYSDWSGIPIRYLRDTEFEHDLQVSGYTDETVAGVWFVHPSDLDYPQIQAFLDEQFIACNTIFDEGDYIISYYVRADPACQILYR